MTRPSTRPPQNPRQPQDPGQPQDTGPSQMVVYVSPDGSVQLDVRLEGDTLWLSQAHLAELFGTTPQNITQHIRRIDTEGELSQEATCKKILQVRQEGSRQVSREVLHYNLDMAISVGYRVTSFKATQFRIWATGVLREYLVKGFAMNDARLKEPEASPYFDELLERIRDIRASEKMFYLKVRDVFAVTSTDYQPKAEQARTFFKTIQNQLLHAVTGRTAAELVMTRADSAHPTMGLTSFSGSQVRKKDITTAKNYLTEDELKNLNRLTTMFLDYAETKAERHQAITMAHWITKTREFLAFNDYPSLDGPGTVSHNTMSAHVSGIYDTFNAARQQAETHQAHEQAGAEFAELTGHLRSLKEQP